jgi:hypothetical protein
MVRRRKDPVVRSAEYYEEQARRRGSQEEGEPLGKRDEDLRRSRATPMEQVTHLQERSLRY